MSFLLFDYTGSAMKNALYSFGSRLIVSQEPDFLFEKTKSSRAYSSHGVLYFFEIFHTCCPYQGLQSFSLVCFVPLNKIEQLSPLEHVDLKLFLTFFVNIYRFRKKSSLHRHLQKYWQGEHTKFQRRLITSTCVAASRSFLF